MSYNVVWSAAAMADLYDLADYMEARSSPAQAKDFIQKIQESTKYLHDFPRLYQIVPNYCNGCRRIVVLGHNLIYRIDEMKKTVYVLRIYGGKMQPREIQLH